MTEQDKTYIPLGRLPSLADVGPLASLTWDLALPDNVDMDRILLHQRHMRRIQHIGMFASTHIMEYQGETTTYDANVGFVQSDGTALASSSGVQQPATKVKTRLLDEPLDQNQRHTSARVEHHFNKAELASLVVDRRRARGGSAEAAWTAEINSMFDAATRAVARVHLAQRPPYTGVARYLAVSEMTRVQDLLHVAR